MRTPNPDLLERILDSAAQLFGKRPFHEVTMDEIAKHANTSKGSIYARFKSKEDLYLGLIVYFGQRLRDDIQTKMAQSESPNQRLLLLIQEVFCFHDRYPYFLELVQRAEVICRGNDQLTENRRKFLMLISQTLESFDPSTHYSPEFSAVALMGMTRAILQATPVPRDDKIPEWIVDHFLFGFARER